MLETLKGYRTIIGLLLYFLNAWAVGSGFVLNADELAALQGFLASPWVGMVWGAFLRYITDSPIFGKG